MPEDTPQGPATDSEVDHFAVIAELEGRPKQAVLLNLSFARLIDDIIKPYDENEPFFIDGVPLTKDKIVRIKVVKLTSRFRSAMSDLQIGMTRREPQIQKTFGEQYDTRFEHILRTTTEDVTSQVIKAYNQAVKPRIKDYLPKREELISAATQLFIQGIKSLAG